MYDYISNYYRPNSILMVTATPRCLMKFAENTPAAAFGRHIELASRYANCLSQVLALLIVCSPSLS